MKMTSVPVRLFMINIPTNEAYSLDSVGKNGFCKLPTVGLFQLLHFCMYKHIHCMFVPRSKCKLCMLCTLTAIEAGPQPNGVVRADIYNYMKEALELALEWISLFNSGIPGSSLP